MRRLAAIVITMRCIVDHDVAESHAPVDEHRKAVLIAGEARVFKQLEDRQSDPEGGDDLREDLSAHPQQYEPVHQRPQRHRR
jgi:hypothetical protein